ncbi:MAG: bifunctional phosphoribosyl-AMP cyclohydrolase/phosphoribosyl-ATP diphosphatase HisIE [Candidatus Eremiobacteraeota bacterium]|nr:bifunctional phosphoribosyl-AMP cyclohydrolase/phosphoribosyl-ATP diphosphatase HisIE [Candidatus Eremiobacteraeota bacterium]
MSIDELAWDERGLLPVVLQDSGSGAVLTLAYANREALEKTLREKTTWLYSRSRAKLWRKGESSGNTQTVLGVSYDCDADALLYRVQAHGPACHTGATSCFANELLAEPPRSEPIATFEGAIASLRATIAARRGASPETSYTAKLLQDGVDRIGKKIGEEATEVVIAAKNGDAREIAWEAADLVYHLLVLLEERGVSPDEVGTELLRRAK